MAEAFIVRRGGGGSGGTLVVTSSGAGTVTVSNSTLGKSYSKTVTAEGSVIFKGLKTGTWTVTLSNGTQTATKTVTINADYSTSIAYFAATISITYPAESTCVVTDSSGETVASDSNTGSSTKTWTATVNATGTYTITATSTSDSSKTKSTTVTITADGQSESVTLIYRYMIFDNGEVLPLSTWKENGTITIGTDSITFDISGAIGSVYTTSPIDLTEYNVLKAKYTCTIQGDRSDWDGKLGYERSAPNNNLKLDSYVSLSVGTDVISSLDISSVTGNQYIAVWGECTATIKEIWLE